MNSNTDKPTENAARAAFENGLQWYQQGVAHLEQGDLQSALDAFRRSLKCNPGAAAAWIGLADVLERNQQFDQALECLHRACSVEPENPKVASRLARSLQRAGRVADARQAYRSALAIDSSSVPALLGAAELAEDEGEPQAAADLYRRVLTAEPHHAEALANILGLGKSVDVSEEMAAAKASMAERGDRDKALIGYGLGKALDRQGEFDHAFSVLTDANAARRRQAGAFDAAMFADRVSRQKSIFSADFFQQRADWGHASARPVFIVGLPRSGTTLTEQIIGSHANCHGAGELVVLSDLATATPDRLGIPDPAWPETAPMLTKQHAEALGQDYVRQVTENLPDSIQRVVDKAPLNFWHLGLLAIALPQARIIHCTRDIRDNGLSIFSQNFSLDQRWSTDLADIASYWMGYRELMAHWADVTGLQLLEVNYEDTVSDTEGQARRLLEFLDLEWDPAVLKFHTHQRAVQTPSKWQVRQPIYQTSAARWRRYEDYLSPLIEAAEKY
ncbi:MAG: sulfotransferase [Pseudomonadota bacterium]